MRVSRTGAVLSIPVAVVLAVVLGSGLLETAGAARPRHDLRVAAKQLQGTDRFVLYGRVLSDPSARIVVVRSIGGGDYHRVQKIKTTRTGRFRTRIYQTPAKVTCFKVIVPQTPGYRRTTSKGASCIES